MAEKRIPVDHLRVGIFIRLELKWYEHPFLTSSFKIKSPDQIRTLKDLGLTHVLYIPEKSDCEPGPVKSPRVEPAAPPPQPDHLWEIKKERIKQLKDRNRAVQKCDKQYTVALERVRSVTQNLVTGSPEVAREASVLIEGMVDSLLSEREIMVHLMNTKSKDEGTYYHTLNVAILSLLLGREYGLDAESLQLLGLGALFHDIGKSRIPKKIILKQSSFTTPERELFQLHTKYGAEIVSRIENFPAGAVEVIQQHHEAFDGTGYPAKLLGQKISPLARVAYIANAYDNHCNHMNVEESMTPHEALSFMFRKQKPRFDHDMLTLFIKCLGIYPPGTVVQLSNDQIGLVVSINQKNQLRPSLLLHDPTVPSNEALIFNLEDDQDLSIVKSIRPAQLPAEVYKYLNPRARVSFFIEPSQAGGMAQR